MNVNIEFHWTQTQRGAPALQIETNLYRIQKINKNGTMRLTCTDERCNASVTMLENEIKYMRGIHRHGERVLPFHIGEVVNQFQQASVSDIKTPIPQIYDRLTKEFRREHGSAAEIPVFQQLRSTAYRKRAKVLPPCPNRTTLRTFNIPEMYRLNSSDEPFLIHDSANSGRLIVFASKTSLNYLGSCTTIHSDGTFKTAPLHFHQSYTIHGWCVDTGMKPVCYSVTEKRSVEIYVTLFQALKDAAATLGINLAPSSHMMDFEPAAVKASKTVFPDTNVKFCHFHFAKAVWRKIKKSKLVIAARKPENQKLIADLVALPMVPIHLVRERFELISRKLRLQNRAFNTFILYFRRTYINSRIFKIQSWNHYDFLGTRPRTNNHLEGSHRQLKRRISSKPNIWQWVMSIQDLDETITIAIEQEQYQNRETRPRHRRDIEKDENLLELKLNLEKEIMNLEEYCVRLRHTSYSYLKRIDTENDG